VNVPSRQGLKKILAPELKTDDCFATGVKRQTLQLKHYKRATCISAATVKENVQFHR